MAAMGSEKPFGTPEQLKAASDALNQYATENPDAYRRFQEMWRAHYLEVGHKALGRMLLGKSAAELVARKAGREDR